MSTTLKLMILDLIHLQESKGEYLTLERVQKQIPEQIRNSKTTIDNINRTLDNLERVGVVKKTIRGYKLKTTSK